MTQLLWHSLSIYSYRLLRIAHGGAASLTVRACDYGFRNEPQNKTGYCGDTNLGFFTILATDSSALQVYSDMVLCRHNCTHKGYFSLKHMYCITTKDLYFLGTFCFSQGIISHLYTTTHITGTQWMCFPNKVGLFIF